MKTSLKISQSTALSTVLLTAFLWAAIAVSYAKPADLPCGSDGPAHARDGGMRGGGMRGGGMRGGDHDQMREGHVEQMVKEVGASAEQKNKLMAIAAASQVDMKPLHDQIRAGHEQGMALFAAAKLDRAAIEQHRVAQTQLMDQLSRRRIQAMLDSAEVLSPEQRAKLAQKKRP